MGEYDFSGDDYHNDVLKAQLVVLFILSTMFRDIL
jgi:hypothetical protein